MTFALVMVAPEVCDTAMLAVGAMMDPEAEAMAEERIDVADKDISSRTLVETHGQQPRHSTRQKFGEA